METVIRGTAAGLLATLAMSIIIAASRASLLFRTPPPLEIIENIQTRLGLRHQKLPEPVFQASWVVAHAAYGAICGALYAVLRPRLPQSRTFIGLLYGALVWVISYLGVLPALKLYPWPDEDTRLRRATMIIAHGVYGLTLAHSEYALENRERTIAPAVSAR